jgi:hypothetical protein
MKLSLTFWYKNNVNVLMYSAFSARLYKYLWVLSMGLAACDRSGAWTWRWRLDL